MNPSSNIILIGGGGHCKSVIEVIESAGVYTIAGIVDRAEMVGQQILGYPVIGTDDDLPSLVAAHRNCHITVGHIQDNAVRVRLYEQLTALGATLPVIVSNRATVSKHANIAAGTVIMHHAMVNASATIGHNCIINTGAVIEHDATIGSHCHISTGAYINGACGVHDHSFVGSRSVLVQGVSIAAKNVIAAGSIVVNNTEPNALYAGSPATLKKRFQ